MDVEPNDVQRIMLSSERKSTTSRVSIRTVNSNNSTTSVSIRTNTVAVVVVEHHLLSSVASHSNPPNAIIIATTLSTTSPPTAATTNSFTLTLTRPPSRGHSTAETAARARTASSNRVPLFGQERVSVSMGPVEYSRTHRPDGRQCETSRLGQRTPTCAFERERTRRAYRAVVGGCCNRHQSKYSSKIVD